MVEDVMEDVMEQCRVVEVAVVRNVEGCKQVVVQPGTLYRLPASPFSHSLC